MSYFLTVEKTARYELIGSIDQAEIIVFVLHGYGQLVTHFAKKFDGLDNKIAIVLPEGLHRYYLSGSSGRVGASWMTKEEREIDIEDNLNYLTSLYNHLSINSTNSRLILMGFSQGGATAARWFAHSPSLFHHLILWASVFPPDILFPSDLTRTGQHFFVLGDEDEYFTENDASTTCRFYEEKGFECVRFNGEHKIDTKVFTGIINRIREKR